MAEWLRRNLGVAGAALALALITIAVAYDFHLMKQPQPPRTAAQATCRIITPPPGCFVVTPSTSGGLKLQSSLRVDSAAEVYFWYRRYITDTYSVDFVVAPDGSWEQTDGTIRRSLVHYDAECTYWLVYNVRKTADKTVPYIPYTTPF